MLQTPAELVSSENENSRKFGKLQATFLHQFGKQSFVTALLQAQESNSKRKKARVDGVWHLA
jgi:hypothetical protein